MNEEERPWQPLTVHALAARLDGADFPWWIAGGYALELALGESIREHADIDVLILRRDHVKFRHHFASWDCWAADPPGTLRPWPIPEALPASVHDIWCRSAPEDSWRFQAMIDEASNEHWCSRRDPSIRLPLTTITRTTQDGIPYLDPAVQLFYKARQPRPKDQLDFARVTQSGINLNRSWLTAAIEQCHGPDHEWLAVLRTQQANHIPGQSS